MVFASKVAVGQYFETVYTIDNKEIPCDAFLYKHSASIVRQAAQNILAKYEVSASYSNTDDIFSALNYFQFSGEYINPLLLRDTDIIFWVMEQGSEKSILYLSAFHNKTDEYVSSLKYSVITKKLQDELNSIDIECVKIFNQLVVADQYQKIFKLNKEIQTLHEDLQRLETYTPNATAKINETKSNLRSKRTKLTEETLVLEQLKKYADS